MKKGRRCQGCGALIQTEDSQGFGFVPESVLLESDNILCKRCFRIRHYGKNELGAVKEGDARETVLSAIKWCDGVILVTDLMDFEGSLPEEAVIQRIKEKELLLVLNKVDLLPPKTTVGEVVKWAKSRFEHTGLFGKVSGVSATKGFGVRELIRNVEKTGKKKILVIGSTNVGKSTLVSRLLPEKCGQTPTVSRFPGTTVSCTRWELNGGTIMSDSPGLVPGGRLSDRLCPECASSLIPDSSLAAKVYPVKAGNVLVVPGFAAVSCISASEEGVLIGYSASQTEWTRAALPKVDQWLQGSCDACHISEWETHSVTLEANQDLTIHGLGWVSARRATFDLELKIPQGVSFSIRPNLIGSK